MPSKKEIAALVDRWVHIKPEMAPLERLDKALAQAGRLPDGRIDLRGLDMSSGAIVDDIALRHVDLSYASIFGTVRRGTFDDVLFVKSALQGNVVGSTLVDCKFHGANLEGVAIQDSVLTRCDFRKARFRRSKTSRATVEDCRFDELKLRRIEWDHSSFVRCSFRDVDVKESSMAWSKFIECDLTGAVFDAIRMGEPVFKDCTPANFSWNDDVRVGGISLEEWDKMAPDDPRWKRLDHFKRFRDDG